jgi:hypothetical protein
MYSPPNFGGLGGAKLEIDLEARGFTHAPISPPTGGTGEAPFVTLHALF